MRITGILLALIEIDADHSAEFNRWYDLDHMPEHLANPDVVAGQRYAAPLPSAPERHSTGGVLHAPFATIYAFGGPLDFTGPVAVEGWRSLRRTLAAQDRLWRSGKVHLRGHWRLTSAVASPSLRVSEHAIPHLAHTGVLLSFARARVASSTEDLAPCWEAMHEEDLLDVDGVLASLRFIPADHHDGLLLRVVLCAKPVRQVMQCLPASLPVAPAGSAEDEPIERLCLLPYERIEPLKG